MENDLRMIFLCEYENHKKFGKIIRINDTVCKKLGYDHQELLNMSIQQILGFPNKLHEIIKAGEDNHSFAFTTTMHAKKDQDIPVEIYGYFFDTFHKKMFLSVAYDREDAKFCKEDMKFRSSYFEDVFQKREELFEKVFENNTEGILIGEWKRNVIWCNQAFTHITGYQQEEVFNKDYLDLPIFKEKSEIISIEKRVYEEGIFTGECVGIRKNNEEYFMNLNVFLIRNKQGDKTHLVVMIRDVTKCKEIEEQMHYLAYRDFLTGLYNRAYLMKTLEEILDSDCKNQIKLALLFIDLDGFKNINDHLGHATGDEVLKIAARRIQSCVRQEDIVARIGGDEFIVLLRSFKNEKDVVNVAYRIQSNFEPVFKISSNQLYVSASIGITIYPDDGIDMDELISRADMAMYKSKKNANHKVQRFKKDLDEGEKERFLLENDLKDALSKDEFYLHYQPIVSIDNERIVGAEALIRWENKRIGKVSPVIFIPLAENNGSIIPIGLWVLKRACMQNKKWQQQGLLPIYVSVNVSIHQIEREDFVKHVQNILRESKLSPEYLELEITESTSVRNIEHILNTLWKLKALGIHISIDDFGTGYSSLGQLKNLPISKLKIDQSFIHEVHAKKEDATIVSAILALAKKLEYPVVAEGIETIEELEFLKENQCEFGQGYLFSKPINPNEFEELLKKLGS